MHRKWSRYCETHDPKRTHYAIVSCQGHMYSLQSDYVVTFLCLKWTKTYNFVSKEALPPIWMKHLIDLNQLHFFIRNIFVSLWENPPTFACRAYVVFSIFLHYCFVCPQHDGFYYWENFIKKKSEARHGWKIRLKKNIKPKFN